MSILELDHLVSQIAKENEDESHITALPEGWNLMLFYFCDFSKEDLANTLDGTGREMIRFVPDYSPEAEEGDCEVCFDHTLLFKNPCGHKFCAECWGYHLRINHTDRELNELFPKCQDEDCYHRTNYYLMEALWKKSPDIKKNFEALLCRKYSQMSRTVRMCPR